MIILTLWTLSYVDCFPFSLTKKRCCCFRKLAGWNSFYHLPARIVECVSEYILFVLKHIHTNKKQKKVEKKREKEKKRKDDSRKKMLLLRTVSVKNQTRYDIVCEFALCTFSLRNRPMNFSWLFIQIWRIMCAMKEVTIFVVL